MHPRYLSLLPNPSGRRLVAVATACCALALAGTTSGAAAVPHASTDLSAPPPQRTAAPAKGVTTTTVSDPDDVDGRFDIAEVSHVVREADRHHAWITYGVRTYPSWIDLRLDRRHRNFVLELNRNRGRGSELNVTVSRQDGHIVAELISNATREVIQRVHVSRLNDHAFTISGPRRVLGARSYFWVSNFHTVEPGPLCGRRGGYPVTCQDSVPRDGWIRLSQPAWPRTAS